MDTMDVCAVCLSKVKADHKLKGCAETWAWKQMGWETIRKRYRISLSHWFFLFADFFFFKFLFIHSVSLAVSTVEEPTFNGVFTNSSDKSSIACLRGQDCSWWRNIFQVLYWGKMSSNSQLYFVPCHFNGIVLKGFSWCWKKLVGI